MPSAAALTHALATREAAFIKGWIAATQIYNRGLIHKLPIIQRKQRCCVVADAGENWKPYVIYTSYINIFQRGEIGALFIWLKYEWHTSIANHLGKNTQLVTTDTCVLFHLKRTE